MALGIVGLVVMLTTLGLSLFISRLASIALMHTGLSAEVAIFQARSAFTGTGFCTREAESITNHPVRRRIVMWLMVVRSAGLVTIVISLFLSFIGPSALGRIWILLALIAGVAALLAIIQSRPVDHFIHRVVYWALRHWTDLEAWDFETLLELSGDYAVSEIRLRDGDWLTGQTVGGCLLEREGVTLLGIARKDGTYLGVPEPGTELLPYDIVVLYGRRKALRHLETRSSGAEGQEQHEQAVQEERSRAEKQQKADREHRRRRVPDENCHENDTNQGSASDESAGTT